MQAWSSVTMRERSSRQSQTSRRRQPPPRQQEPIESGSGRRPLPRELRDCVRHIPL